MSAPVSTELRWLQALTRLPRYPKRAVVIGSDLILASLVLWAAVSLRYGAPYWPPTLGSALMMAAGPLITVATLGWFGQYRVMIRYMGYGSASRIFLFVILSVLIWSWLLLMVGQLGVPRSTLIVYALSVATLLVLSRVVAGVILERSGLRILPRRDTVDRKPVLIYGASKMGVDLLHALERSRERRPIGFIDASPSLWGQYLKGVKIYRPERLPQLLEHQGVREVILALPQATRRERREILGELKRYPVDVKIMPAYDDIASGRVGITDLRAVDVGDLLGRDPVPPMTELLSRQTTGRSILITGAGGSIGSELVRQILKHAPRNLVLLDIAEPALYKITGEVHALIAAMGDAERKTTVRSVLGSVTDASLIGDVIATEHIETIYHAAAYKHVPIVEDNVVAGLNNNVYGTRVVAECAKAGKVERVVFISTDKAVRPTNVMGASKRVSELVLQAAAAESSETVFTMVRFGNVLDSSGSVVPLFRRQIRSGGPVTVTHAEVVRYFMSIPEAAELVLQAGAMAKGGEVFVLEMGDPVKILDLARLMINLSGLTVRDATNPEGDIEIVFTGLRPGEKLYEELLIGAHTTGTEHSRILKSDEPFLPALALNEALDLLHSAMQQRDLASIDLMLRRLVEGYSPQRPASDISPQAAWRSPPSGTVH